VRVSQLVVETSPKCRNAPRIQNTPDVNVQTLAVRDTVALTTASFVSPNIVHANGTMTERLLRCFRLGYPGRQCLLWSTREIKRTSAYRAQRVIHKNETFQHAAPFCQAKRSDIVFLFESRARDYPGTRGLLPSARDLYLSKIKCRRIERYLEENLYGNSFFDFGGQEKRSLPRHERRFMNRVSV